MTDETTANDDSTDTTPNQLQLAGEFIEHVRKHPAATVEEYDVAVDMWADTEVELTVTLAESAETFEIEVDTDGTVAGLVKEKIDELAKGYENGVPKDDVLDPQLYTAEVSDDELADALAHLRTIGEVYEPRVDELRTV